MGDLISIIVPVYNVGAYLRECLESIRKQSYKNLEVILVDDGSKDGSGTICEEYAAKDLRFHVLHQENRGVWAAKTAGIQNASGRYIGFVDSDDWIDSNTYFELYHRLIEVGAGMVICKKNIYDENLKSGCEEDSIVDEGVYEGAQCVEIYRNIFFNQNYTGIGLPLNLCDKLFDRDLILRNYKYVDKRLHYFEDIALSLFCILQARSIAIYNKAFYYYRQRRNSLCHSTDPCYLEQLNIFYNSVYPAVADHSEELLERLHVYIADRAVYGLNRMMGLNLKHEIPFYLPPFEKIPLTDRVVLYGAGEMGRRYYRMFQLSRSGQIVRWVDRQYERLRQSGILVDGPEVLQKERFDKVLIAVQFKDQADKIKEELMRIGIAEEKVVWDHPSMLIQA